MEQIMINADLIQGWGRFQRVHELVFPNLPDGAIVVELGVAYGRGLAAMVQKAQEMKRNFRIVGVDHFQGSAGEAFDYGEMSIEATTANILAAGAQPNQFE